MTNPYHYMRGMYVEGADGRVSDTNIVSKIVSQSIHSRMHLPSVVMDLCFDYLPPRNCLYINKARSAIATVRRAFVAQWYPHPILDALGGIDKCVRDYTFFKGVPGGRRVRYALLGVCERAGPPYDLPPEERR